MRTTFGFSLRQGPHHDAQKSINTTFPFKLAKLIFVFRSIPSSSKSGETFPGERSAASFNCLASSCFLSLIPWIYLTYSFTVGLSAKLDDT